MATRFVASGANAKELQELGGAEFAFVGRANVGKSSLVGALIGAPKLVRTSRTPGRTQMLNLFESRTDFALVDLPGYGYAKLSKKHRASLKKMIFEFIVQRPCLTAVVQIVDARREKVSEDDLELTDWVLSNECPLVTVITKIDLIPKTKRLPQVKKIEESLGIPRGSAVLCSSKTGEGRKILYSRLLEMC